MRFFRALKFIVSSAYCVLDTAELRTYDWDGVFPRAEWHGWCSMFGTPYKMRLNSGVLSAVPGGWLDVKVFGDLSVTAKVTGTGAGAGVLSIQFQGAMSLFDGVIRDEPSNMQFSADIDGTDEIETHESINVARWNYIRFWSAENLSAVDVDLELVTHDGVRPVKLPAGTGV